MNDNENTSNLTFKMKSILTLLGIFFFSTSLFIILSSISFNFDESGWLVLSNQENKNIFGIYGSYASGFLLKEFGLLTPICLSLIFLIYSFKYVKRKLTSKPWSKLILMISLIFLSGLLSQPFHSFLSVYFFEESKILTYQGFSFRTYESILDNLNKLLKLSNGNIIIVLNLSLTILFILNFIYVASTSFKELLYIKIIFKPLYLPIIWTSYLLNNLFFKKVYIETENDIYKEKMKNGFINKLNELFNIIMRKKK